MAPSGAFEPTQPGTPGYEMGSVEPQEELITEERMLGIVRTFLVTTPNLFKRPWLAAPDDELLPFVHELTLYCNAHDISPEDYLGDWFPLAITGVAVGAGVLERHRTHKKETGAVGKKDKNFDSSTGYSEDHTPVEKKGTEYDSASGTNLPEEEYKEDDKNGNEPDSERPGGAQADVA